MRGARHIPALAACAALVVVAGCQRDDEAQMRARLAPMFAVGETLAFSAGTRCAAGAFRLVHDAVGSGLPVEDSVNGWLRTLAQRDAAAVDRPDLSPDAAMIAAANSDRPLGMAMRGRALEARACMDDRIRAEFMRLLRRDATVIGYDKTEGAVMLMDRGNAILVVAMGERP